VGPTGPAGANGTNGVNGATGPAGPTGPAGTGGTGGSGPGTGQATNFGQFTGTGSTGGLASGKQESGTWSASIWAAPGTSQQQAQGVVSFPIPLKHLESVKLNYRNESESNMATAPCVGTVNEPVIQPVGNFCAYRGEGFGSKEKGSMLGNVDTNVQGLTGCGTTAVPVACTGTEVGPKFESAKGEIMTEHTGEGNAGVNGLLLVFRTTKFSQEAAVALEAGEEATMNAIGGWGVAAK
jgi:hypothetical protein